MNGIVAQIISMFSFGLSNALWRKPISKLVVEEAIVYRTIFTLLIFTVLLLTVDNKEIVETYPKVFGLNIWLFTILISCLSYFGLFFFNKALKHATTGLVVIVTTTSFLFSQFTAFVFLGETAKKGYLLPFALFLIAIVVSDYASIKSIKLSKGVLYGLLAALFWGITLPLLSIPANEIGYIKTGFILEVSVMLMSLLSLYFVHKGELNLKRFKADLPFFILLGICAGSGVLFNNLSYTKIPVYVAASIASVTHLVSIIAALLLFKENLKPQQYVAALVALVGIFVIAVNEST